MDLGDLNILILARIELWTEYSNSSENRTMDLVSKFLCNCLGFRHRSRELPLRFVKRKGRRSRPGFLSHATMQTLDYGRGVQLLCEPLLLYYILVIVEVVINSVVKSTMWSYSGNQDIGILDDVEVLLG